ncbi:MAG: 5-methylthioadenosine phosphorylase [Abditibacteriota bacterium]|nr:5-methylthioadenosine phosphorylase [Abditibacteriota bacterium]
MSSIAIIGGTGLDLRSDSSPLQHVRDERLSTRWGDAFVTHAKYFEREIVFLHRHAAPDGSARRVPPHQINYRANIAALKKLGVTAILASTAVGSLRSQWCPGTLVLLDQFLDFTTSRPKTFFDERPVHVDVTQPYCPHLRTLLQSTSSALNVTLEDGGTYLCAEGPRFETPAEIRLFAGWGADVIGMTGVPEAVLAREAEISYAGVSIVTNLAAGISPQPLTQTEVLDAMKEALPHVAHLFLEATRHYRDDPEILSRRAVREFATSDFDPSRWITN